MVPTAGKDKDLNFKAYDAPTRGVYKSSENTQESNPIFTKKEEEDKEDDTKIKLKNVKSKWHENMEEEEEEKKKKEAPKVEEIKKVEGSFNNPFSTPATASKPE